MIIIYYSNKLECLKTILIELISNQKLDNPLHSEIILSENISMAEWLYIKISEHFGVSANIQFFTSYDFIWNILGKSLWGIFPDGILSHSIISWILMKIFSRINSKDTIYSFSVIKEYLDDDLDQNKCLQLSEKIKSLFIQYFMYHQDWLFQWEHGKMVEKLDKYVQSWQSELWRLFLEEVNDYKNRKSLFCFQNKIYEYIVDFLGKNNIDFMILPKQIFVYGVSYFPPILLDILQALGKYINIYIFCINPCHFFLKNNINYNNIIGIIKNRSHLFQCFSNITSLNIFNRNVFLSNQKQISNNIGNSLLSFLGGRFQEIFYSLLQLEFVDEKKVFLKNINFGSVLHMLQNDILCDYSKNEFSVDIIESQIENIHLDIEDHVLRSDDRSLSVHICHNIQREIEVLHDNLLAIISDNPSLLLHDIAVMAPNIDCYISSIRSVFGSSSSYGRHLSFTIFDHSTNNINEVMSSFLKLLSLSHMKCSVEEILEFLSVQSLAVRFDIDQEGLKLLSAWISESGICWGLDDDIFSDISMSSSGNIQAQHTWRFGVTRMLLGYAINSSSGFWDKVLPYDVGDSISSIDLVGQLSFFLVKLKYWRDRFLKSYTLEEWFPMAEEIINDFYIIDYNVETESTLIKLKFFWKEIINSGIQANYSQPVSINILYKKLHDKLNKKIVKHHFFSGNILFCNLDSVESIPFKVIYLLGMNVNTYPTRNKLPLNFDLMEYEVRHSDCHAWCNGCYLFLAALLSARELLYISFVGYSIHDHTKTPPSIVVDELFKYIIRNFFYIEKNTRKILPITMDWIYHNLCYWHTYMPFSLKNFTSGNKYQSFFKEWLPILYTNIDIGSGKFLCSLPKTLSNNIVSLNSLRDFYFHPIRVWFQKRLKIYMSKIIEFPLDEPFFVPMHIKYQICENLISSFLNKENINIIYARFRYSGMLPYGNFGNIFWMQQCEMMEKLSRIVNMHYLPTDRHSLQFSLIFHDNIQLNGRLDNVQKNGLLRWKPGILSMRDGLLLWLEHLVYCAIGGRGDSWMFGINSSWHFVSLSHIEAKEYLFFLISGYLDGMNIPLLLLSRSGGCWLRSCFDVKEKSISTDLNCQIKARYNLIAAWEGNKYICGDSSDPYVKKLIPQLQDKNIESIILSSKKYFLMPMKFNIPD